jgi:protein-S-isoprenylcysteine O-methyltransferase Ste14
MFFCRGYNQAVFFSALVLYVWFFPPKDSLEGTWVDTLVDTAAVLTLISGELLRIWSVTYAGNCTRSRRLKALTLVTAGPYAFTRNPIYLGNFLMGFGLIVISDAFAVLPFFVALFVLQYRLIVRGEESFLAERFGLEYDFYRRTVPRWWPKIHALRGAFKFGPWFCFKELGTAWGIIFGALVLEWIEAPLHRLWVTGFYDWLSHFVLHGGIS